MENSSYNLVKLFKKHNELTTEKHLEYVLSVLSNNEYSRVFALNESEYNNSVYIDNKKLIDEIRDLRDTISYNIRIEYCLHQYGLEAGKRYKNICLDNERIRDSLFEILNKEVMEFNNASFTKHNHLNIGYIPNYNRLEIIDLVIKKEQSSKSFYIGFYEDLEPIK